MINFNHLREVNETYGEHMQFAMGMAGRMFLGSLMIFIHAIIPWIFITNGSDVIRKCYGIVNKKFKFEKE